MKEPQHTFNNLKKSLVGLNKKQLETKLSILHKELFLANQEARGVYGHNKKPYQPKHKTNVRKIRKMIAIVKTRLNESKKTKD